MSLYQQAEKLLLRAGVKVNGPAPTDIQVRGDPEALFKRIFSHGRLGFGEAFMDGEWDVEDLTGLVTLLHQAHLSESVENVRTFVRWLVQAMLSYKQTRKRGHQVATAHYNMGNDLFELMLDRLYMMYSCALYRSGAKTLEEAQTAKCDLTCRKLDLKPGMCLLDVGSGYTAGLLRHAVTNYGVTGVGIVNSEEMAKLSSERVKGLPIEIKLGDYRDLSGRYERIASLGMLEHVGPGNYRTYSEKLRSLITDDGLALVHWIGSRKSAYACDPWFDKYIFPNGVAGSLAQVLKSVEGLFVCEDVDNFGADYELTTLAWFKNLDEHWPELEATYGSKDDPTFRMMRYYLQGVAGGFRARFMQLYQVVLSPHGVPGGYMPVR